MTFLTVVKAKDVEAIKGSGIVGLSPTPPANELEKDFIFESKKPGQV